MRRVSRPVQPCRTLRTRNIGLNWPSAELARPASPARTLQLSRRPQGSKDPSRRPSYNRQCDTAGAADGLCRAIMGLGFQRFQPGVAMATPGFGKKQQANDTPARMAPPHYHVYAKI